ncbi:PREDICTED: late embryogenesis abundant protein D-34-like [Nicotiana attenuata]|uniref:Late embryogenesis abundant protein d-34 n=1 Tax=Nicotiana attenuata TaxID=49451 RepID=A0A1J6J9Q0_NICAT|nr:PREDICTED: late embryogenesis abundant protein D-34-like [Nicotiana attenuata]OIT03953.1 late embryogenesis abundant protein d-34 [Nicotiana attenuata]
MSQEQPTQDGSSEPIKYGDVFEVSSELASKPVAPQDATIMQSAESIALGHVPRGGPASIMQSAAAQNERLGAISRDDMTDIARDKGVTVSQTEVGGTRLVSEAVAGEVVGQYIYPSEAGDGYPTTGVQSESTTIGEALEAVALTAGDKPIEQSDAAAIQAAEVRATGVGELMPGGIGAEAQHAAAINARTKPEDDKTTLSDVLTDATSRLIGDKAVKKEDAEGVVGSEIRTRRDLATLPGGVAASMAVASSLNQF